MRHRQAIGTESCAKRRKPGAQCTLRHLKLALQLRSLLGTHLTFCPHLNPLLNAFSNTSMGVNGHPVLPRSRRATVLNMK
jgi:hypothetical protein